MHVVRQKRSARTLTSPPSWPGCVTSRAARIAAKSATILTLCCKAKRLAEEVTQVNFDTRAEFQNSFPLRELAAKLI